MCLHIPPRPALGEALFNIFSRGICHHTSGGKGSVACEICRSAAREIHTDTDFRSDRRARPKGEADQSARMCGERANRASDYLSLAHGIVAMRMKPEWKRVRGKEEGSEQN